MTSRTSAGADALTSEAAIVAVFDAPRARPFDLGRRRCSGPVPSAWPDDVFQLTIAEHHAILDGWSFTSLLTEILERHAALIADPASPRRRHHRPPPSATSWRPSRRGRPDEQSWRTGARGSPASAARCGPPRGRRRTAEIPRTVERVLPDAPAQLRAIARRRRRPDQVGRRSPRTCWRCTGSPA